MIACPSVVKLCGCILNGWMSSILSVVVYHLSLITTYTSGRCSWVQLRSCVFFRVVFSSNMALWREIQLQRFGMETMKPTMKKWYTLEWPCPYLVEDGEGGPTWVLLPFPLTLSFGQGAWKRQSICVSWPQIRPLRWKPAGTFWKLYHHSVFWRMYRSSVNVNIFMHPHTYRSTVGVGCL